VGYYINGPHDQILQCSSKYGAKCIKCDQNECGEYIACDLNKCKKCLEGVCTEVNVGYYFKSPDEIGDCKETFGSQCK